MALDAIAELGARNVLIGHGAGAFALFREERRTLRFEARIPPLEPLAPVGRRRRDARRLPRRARRRAAARRSAALGRRDRRRSDARGRRRPVRSARGLARLAANVDGDARVEPVERAARPSGAGGTIDHGRRAQSSTARAAPRARGEVRQGRADVRRRAARSGRVARPPERRLDRDAAHALASRSRSRSSRRRWTPSPRRAWRSRSRARAASGSSTATCRSRTQVAEVDKVKRSESGMIVEPVTLPPDALVSDALDADEHVPHQRRADHRRERRARRHPHEPRPALRGRRRRSRSPR